MLLRILAYFFITLGLLYLFLTWRQRKEEKFIASLRVFISIGGLAIVFLVIMNIGTKEEQSRHYQIYDSQIRERKLLASEWGILKGIENIPSDAKLVFATDSTPTLVAPKGQFFTWGPFRLKEMELAQTMIRLDARHFFGETNEYAKIHGVRCKLAPRLELTRKNQTSGYRFDDFRVSACDAQGIEFYLEDQKLPSEEAYVSFYDSANHLG